MLNVLLGTPVEIAGQDFIHTREGAKGHVLYGPYVLVNPGAYVVEFSVARADGETMTLDGPCAFVDVTALHGQLDLAFDFIMASDLGHEPRVVTVAFDLVETRTLEFRLYTPGTIPLLVGDNPLLRVRRPDESMAPTAPDRHAMVLKTLFFRDVPFRLQRDEDAVVIARQRLGDLLGYSASDDDLLARQIAETVGFKGDDANALYRAFMGADQPAISPPHPVPFSSTLCQQAHFGYDQYRFWSRALKEAPKFYRKQWEFVFIAQVLFERGYLAADNKGLVFGAGQEQLPALFASFGVEILATDQAAEQAERSGWTTTNQHTFDLTALNQRGICTDRMFNALVSFQPADMNAIPASLDGQFDFCWSACALEHLGSIEHGLAFIENSMRTLKPGGVAVHTTEFNLTSNDDTLETQHCSFFRRRDIDDIIARLERQGFEVAPMDWQVGEGFAERVADLPPYGRGEPHIRLRADRFEVTSIGLIITRPLA